MGMAADLQTLCSPQMAGGSGDRLPTSRLTATARDGRKVYRSTVNFGNDEACNEVVKLRAPDMHAVVAPDTHSLSEVGVWLIALFYCSWALPYQPGGHTMFGGLRAHAAARAAVLLPRADMILSAGASLSMFDAWNTEQPYRLHQRRRQPGDYKTIHRNNHRQQQRTKWRDGLHAKINQCKPNGHMMGVLEKLKSIQQRVLLQGEDLDMHKERLPVPSFADYDIATTQAYHFTRNGSDPAEFLRMGKSEAILSSQSSGNKNHPGEHRPFVVKRLPHRSYSASEEIVEQNQSGRTMESFITALKRTYDKRMAIPFRKKIYVYRTDDRLKISPPLLRKFPYSNIVRLSTGCTGTLVTPFHVITAAHCVHNGRHFRNHLEMLKVEIPDTMGVRVYYIEKIGIPGKWLAPRTRHDYQASWDYAVVRLSYGAHGRSQFLPLAVPTAAVLDQNLQFLGFPSNGNGLWRSVCPARSNKAMVDGNLILTPCDSAVGNSGAAVFTHDNFRGGNKIIGVLSSTMPVGRMPFYTRFSIIAALTWPKLYDICAEIGPLGESYGVCPPLATMPRSSKIQLNNKVIPFFG